MVAVPCTAHRFDSRRRCAAVSIDALRRLAGGRDGVGGHRHAVRAGFGACRRTGRPLREALDILERLGAGRSRPSCADAYANAERRVCPAGPRETTRANPQGLTSKEIEVLSLLALGDSNAQLGRRLHRSTKTIDHHVSSILEKLGVRTRAEALATAYALGIVAFKSR